MDSLFKSRGIEKNTSVVLKVNPTRFRGFTAPPVSSGLYRTTRFIRALPHHSLSGLERLTKAGLCRFNQDIKRKDNIRTQDLESSNDNTPLKTSTLTAVVHSTQHREEREINTPV